jgi:hypothetical protein
MTKAYSSFSSFLGMRCTVPEPRITSTHHLNNEEDKDFQGEGDVPVIHFGTINFHSFLSREEETLVGLQFAYSMDWEDDLSLDVDEEDCTQSISTCFSTVTSVSSQSQNKASSQPQSLKLSGLFSSKDCFSRVSLTGTSIDAKADVLKRQLPPRRKDDRPNMTTTATITSSLRFLRSSMDLKRHEGGRRILPLQKSATTTSTNSAKTFQGRSFLSADVKRPQPRQCLPLKKSKERQASLAQRHPHRQGYDRPFWNRCFA